MFPPVTFANGWIRPLEYVRGSEGECGRVVFCFVLFFLFFVGASREAAQELMSSATPAEPKPSSSFPVTHCYSSSDRFGVE